MEGFKIERDKKEESKASYLSEKRDVGCGKLRLGSIFSYNEGIYSVLYIANIKREYFKLSLFNEEVKVQLKLEELAVNKKKRRILTGHKKAFKGITQSIRSDKASIYK